MAIVYGSNYITPTLDLNFAKSKNLKDSISGRELITYTRNSIGTYVGPDGLIKYAVANEPRFDHNPLTGESLGLLVEESRTNSQTYSNDFLTNWILNQNGTTIVTPNATISPSGQVDASKLSNTTGAYIYGPPFISGNNIGFGRSATFNLSTGNISTQGFNVTASLVAVGNGWFRCVFIPNTSIQYAQTIYAKAAESSILTIEQYVERIQLSVTGGINSGVYIWGAQVEAGTFPTSYIPTKASTVTRSVDVASITGTNFSSWYNQSEGTIFSNFNTPVKSSSAALQLYSIRNSTPTEFLEFYTGNSATDGITLDVVGGRQFAFYTRNQVDNGKYALALKQNDFAISKNGATPLTDTNGLMSSSVDRFLIGGGTSGSYTLNGTISRLTYYPQRLPNTQLQLMTR